MAAKHAYNQAVNAGGDASFAIATYVTPSVYRATGRVERKLYRMLPFLLRILNTAAIKKQAMAKPLSMLSKPIVPTFGVAAIASAAPTLNMAVR